MALILVFELGRTMPNYLEIRASYNSSIINVYQAYNDLISKPAVLNNKFVSPYNFSRMTWIKPSFLWMMERSDWASKKDQENILCISVKREFFDHILSIAINTSFEKGLYSNYSDWENRFSRATVHFQWDPERDIRGKKLEYRSIQLGISRHLIKDFNENGIVKIENITPLVKKIHSLLMQGNVSKAKTFLPKESVYPLEKAILKNIIF